jgi:hypothetical protein
MADQRKALGKGRVWRPAAGVDARPTEQHSRNQKRRPEMPPQAEGLPHEESAQAAKILNSCNT